MGDSADEIKRETMKEFLSRLSDVASLKMPAHLVLDDPAGNSYVQVKNPRLFYNTFNCY